MSLPELFNILRLAFSKKLVSFTVLHGSCNPTVAILIKHATVNEKGKIEFIEDKSSDEHNA